MSRRYFPTVVRPTNGYPTSDHRPMAETDLHRKLMTLVIDTLIGWFADRPDVYVTGNLLLFYEPKNKRRHVAPDCFVVFGVPNYDRPNYLLWDERRPPNVAIEVTSKTTKAEDTKKKYQLYRDTIGIPEYFLFDPKADYLDPPLQGYRLADGEYRPIAPVGGRLPSAELGLELERDGETLRFWNPATSAWLLTPAERLTTGLRRFEEAEAENTRLRQEMAELRKRLGDGGSGKDSA
jgi:Uma2 family endonuclease